MESGSVRTTGNRTRDRRTRNSKRPILTFQSRVPFSGWHFRFAIPCGTQRVGNHPLSSKQACDLHDPALKMSDKKQDTRLRLGAFTKSPLCFRFVPQCGVRRALYTTSMSRNKKAASTGVGAAGGRPSGRRPRRAVCGENKGREPSLRGRRFDLCRWVYASRRSRNSANEKSLSTSPSAVTV